MPRHSIIWTERMRTRLRELHGAGASVQVSAETLSREFGIKVSHGAVTGQRDRLGLCSSTSGKGRALAGREAWQKAWLNSRAMRRRIRDGIEQDQAEAVATRAAVAARPTDLVLVRQVEDGGTCGKASDCSAVPVFDGTAHWTGPGEPPRGRCAWPIGEVGEAGFGFCGAGPTVSARGLCDHHDALSRPAGAEVAEAEA